MKTYLENLLLREAFVNTTREFFKEQEFHEVIPAILNPAVPNEPYLYPFTTGWANHGEKHMFYLPTSPERALKIALGEGMGDCFAIGHSFRNLESSGSLHSPEFLMLEWYRENADYLQIMEDVKTYVTYVRDHVESFPKSTRYLDSWRTVSIRDVFEKLFCIDYEKIIMNDNIIFACASRLEYSTKCATWRQLFDQIMVNEIESQLPDGAVFLVDFPSRVSPLCKVKDNESHIAERFELYINKVEIANGNNESLDVKHIQELFEKESKVSGAPIDVNFLDALQNMKNSKQQFAGVGLGIERLMMVLLGEDAIMKG